MRIIKTKALPLYFLFALLVFGLIIRVYIFFDNRNLFIDESNLARNVFEKNIFELWLPLDYEQYAPPFFLTATKIITTWLGYGEKVFRLIPFACALVSFVFMYKIFRLLNLLNYAWFAMGTMALSPILIRYSCEFKQYTIDFLVSSILIYYCIKAANSYSDSIRNSKTLNFNYNQFFISWLFLGSFVIWVSMPSVFSLAGIALLFFYLFYQNKTYNFIWLFAAVSFVWFIQFSLYYWFILKEQAFSEYLQNFHAGYFLYFSDFSIQQIVKNVKLIFSITQNLFNGKAIFFIAIILLYGGFLKFILKCKKNYLYAFLLLPFIFLLLAASIKTYSLIPRLLLFIYPSVLIIITIGLREIFKAKFLRLTFIVYGGICLGLLFFDTIKKPLKVEEITEVLNEIKGRENVSETKKVITQFAQPAFHYYTLIHPDKLQYNSLNSNLIFLNYGDDLCVKLNESIPKDSVFIFIASCLYPKKFYENQRNCVLNNANIIKNYTAPSAEIIIAQMK